MRKQLTAEQQAKRDARRAQFKALWKQVADMPEADRLMLAAKVGIVTCEGRDLSIKNQCLLAFQYPTVTVVGGFKQWLKQGRCVQKGQHGLMIWVPIGHKTTEQLPDGNTVEHLEKSGFVIGTVFDISQTIEIETNANRFIVPTGKVHDLGAIKIPEVQVVPITDESRLLEWHESGQVIELEVCA